MQLASTFTGDLVAVVSQEPTTNIFEVFNMNGGVLVPSDVYDGLTYLVA